MAAMSTSLTEFDNDKNSRTYFYTGHTAQEPRLVLQKRKVPTGNQVIIEDVISVLSSTENSSGELLDSRVVMSVTVRRPKDGIAADVTAVLAVFRDIVAGDEFGLTVNDSRFLK